MRITGTPGANTSAVERVVEVAPSESSAAPAAASSAPAGMQSAVLQPALAALREMPDIDHAKVASLRDALERGEVRFDAKRLAGLIERFHGGRHERARPFRSPHAERAARRAVQ
jgi:negative regulator of flagellin synthesis FlgM